ncbi:MAG: hypothetical protein P4L69_05180 [Desulfosporosinus sp.]|nr:hypothetical protein [Desulfosporosinus sp.]
MAFLAGAVAGGCLAGALPLSSKTTAPCFVPPPPPPLPSAVIQRKSKKMLSMRPPVVNLHLEQILDPSTGEDIRIRKNKTQKVALDDILKITGSLKKAPRLLTIDEKKSSFSTSPLLVELLKVTPQII